QIVMVIDVVPGGRNVAEIDVVETDAVPHQPFAGVAGVIAPQDVAAAIAVVVADTGHVPVDRNVALVDIAAARTGGTHQPDPGVTGIAAPDDVTRAIAVEVAAARDTPVGRDRADVDIVDAHARPHQPDPGVTGIAAPENVVCSIAVVVAGAGHIPVGWNVA